LDIIDKKTEAETYFINNKDKLKAKYPNIENLKNFIINAFVLGFAKEILLTAYIGKNMMEEGLL